MKSKSWIQLVVFSIAVFSQACMSGELSNNQKAEIDHLFTYLKFSGCTFNRNGTWYSANEAADHLQKKYEYLLKKDMITTTESFIEKAATESSMSGKAYEVKCQNNPAVPSATWFTNALIEYRKSAPNQAGKH